MTQFTSFKTAEHGFYGCQWLKHNFVHYMDEVAVPETKYAAKYQTLFSRIGSISCEHAIMLVPYAVLWLLRRRGLYSHETSCQKELQCVRVEGITWKVTVPTAWSASIVAVQKTSGAVSICVDLTHLEKSVWREQLVLPMVMSCLKAANVSYKLDPNSAFYQVSFSD